MVSWKPFVELKTSSGQAIRRENVTITPEAQAFVVRFPFGGFVWNRPVAILVEREGRQERFPIVDATRMAVFGIAGAGTALILITVLAGFILRRAYKE